MIKYHPEQHTPDALAEQVQNIYDNHPDILIVGSLGRAAIYEAILGDAEYEYKISGRKPTQRWSLDAADIDLINAASLQVSGDELFEVDINTFGGDFVDIYHDEHNWVIHSVERGFRNLILPQVMKPVVSKTIYGADCRTVPLQTHLALVGMSGDFSFQDMEAFGALCDAADLAGSVEIPEVFFYPFNELRRINSICLSLGITKKPVLL